MSLTIKQNEILAPLVLALAALLTLIIAAALDGALFRLQLHARSTFEGQPYLWALGGFKIMLAALLLSVAWVADRYLAPSRLGGILLLISGAIAVFYPALTFVLNLGSSLPFAGRLSEHFLFAGAYLAVLGGFLILTGGNK